MAQKKSGAAQVLRERDHRKHAPARKDGKREAEEKHKKHAAPPAKKGKHGKADETPSAKVKRGDKEKAPKQAKKGANAADDEEVVVAEDIDEDDDDLAPPKKGGKATDRKEVKDLLALGRDKGFLTYDEVNDALPSDIVSSDQIDDVMSMFGDNDI